MQIGYKSNWGHPYPALLLFLFDFCILLNFVEKFESKVQTGEWAKSRDWEVVSGEGRDTKFRCFFGRVGRAQTEPRWRTTSWISLIWTGMGMTAMRMGTGTATRLTTGVSWGTWSRPGHGCRYGTRITTFMARLPIIHYMGMGMGMRRLPSATVPPGYRQGMNQRGENIVQVNEWMNEKVLVSSKSWLNYFKTLL